MTPAGFGSNPTRPILHPGRLGSNGIAHQLWELLSATSIPYRPAARATARRRSPTVLPRFDTSHRPAKPRICPRRTRRDGQP